MQTTSPTVFVVTSMYTAIQTTSPTNYFTNGFVVTSAYTAIQTTSPTVFIGLHQYTLQYKLLYQRFSLLPQHFTNGCVVTSVYTAIQTTSPTGFCCYISIHKALLTVKAVDISTPCTTHYVTEVTAP